MIADIANDFYAYLHDSAKDDIDLAKCLFQARNTFGVSDVVVQREEVLFIIRGRKYRRRVTDKESRPFLDAAHGAAKENAILSQILASRRMVDIGLPLASGRARVHVYSTIYGRAMAARIQPGEIPRFADLFGSTMDTERTREIISILVELYTARQGLVVISGPVRSGKTFLEHASYEYLNNPATAPNGNQTRHILCVGDPLEFLHASSADCVSFTEQEVGTEVESYADAVRGALRIPHDIFAMSEMRGERDLAEEVIRLAINGHLTSNTAHTSSIIHTKNRYVESGGDNARQRLNMMFKEGILGIFNLRLLPDTNGGEILAVEYANFMHDPVLLTALDDPKQMQGVLGVRGDPHGSRTLTADVRWLESQGYIAKDTAEGALRGI